jgi:UDP-glucose 4-epimerase
MGNDLCYVIFYITREINMKALVTGGAGFIGSNLVDRLIEDGHSVVVIDNESAVSNEKFYWNPKAYNVNADVCSYDHTRKLYDGVDCVFHLAAESRIPQCIEDPLKAIRTNVLGTGMVLQCAREAGVQRVVYSSTSSAYGLKNQPPLTETMSVDCLNPYSATKVSGEALCKMYSDLFGLQTVVFRYFNVYGERQPVRGQYATVTGIFIRQNRAAEPLTIVGDGEQRRDFVYVGDVVDANILASNFYAPAEYEWGQVYNIGTGKNYSVNEVASMISSNFLYIPPRDGEARVTLSDSSKANKELGWIPKVCLEDWIAQHK